jgi:hypothetical protein
MSLQISRFIQVRQATAPGHPSARVFYRAGGAFQFPKSASQPPVMAARTLLILRHLLVPLAVDARDAVVHRQLRCAPSLNQRLPV